MIPDGFWFFIICLLIVWSSLFRKDSWSFEFHVLNSKSSFFSIVVSFVISILVGRAFDSLLVPNLRMFVRSSQMKTVKEGSHQGIQTCHLCGKVQCGQRLGRVKCAYCSRIFCLQQLHRKFGIIATANDPSFKCPRCTGICCCMCNCQRPPPHVHCKVYKVRQNKVRLRTLVKERRTHQTKSMLTRILTYRFRFW